MSKPDQIVKEIENYLKSDPQKLNAFNKLLSSINENMSNPDQIYNQIIELIQENKQLVDTFTHGIDNFDTGIEGFNELVAFIQIVDVNTNSRSNNLLFAEFSRMISLFTNELITIQFFYERISKLTASLPSNSRRAILQALNNLVNRIRNPKEKAFFKTIRENFLKEINDEFIIDPEFVPSILVQMLVMTGCVCNSDQIKIVLRSLKLYSSDLIPIDGVYRWIQPINHTIAQAFDNAAQTENILNFYPPTIFESMKKNLTTNQLKWALGETLYNILNENEELNEKPLSLLNLALKYKKEYIKQKDRNEPATVPYIAELQCVKMFKIITIMADFYCSDNSSPPKIPSYLIDLLFGPEKFEQDDAFYAILIDKCLSLGTEANMIVTHFMDQRLNSYIPSSNDWRVAFHEKLQKRYIVPNLFFIGRTLDIRNDDDDEDVIDIDILKETSNIIKKFSTKFTKLNPKAIDAFLKMFEGGDFELIEEAAIAVGCFMEMLEMVDEVRFSPKENSSITESLPKISDMVWEEVSPLINFDGLSIANIDISLKYFIRNLHKAYEKCPQQFELSKYSFPPTGIAFHFSVKENNFSIKGYINPAFD